MTKDRWIDDPLKELSFEDLETLIEKSAFVNATNDGLKRKRANSYSSDYNGKNEREHGKFSILNRYGSLGEGQFAPLFAKVRWFGYERYDIRRWNADGLPGKGITLTYEELIILSRALDNFDFSKRYSLPIRKYEGGRTTAKFYHLISRISYSKNKDVIWTKEANVIDWGYGQKVDLREWSSDYKKCHKGICISIDELKRLKTFIDSILKKGR